METFAGRLEFSLAGGTPMKISMPVLLALSVVSLSTIDSTPATAGGRLCNGPSRWSDRHATCDSRMDITTRDGKVTMLLTSDVVAVQLSDRKWAEVRRKLRAERAEHEGNVLARAIKTVVLSGVRTLLDHSAECPIDEIRSVDYRGDRLVFTTYDGERVFENIDVEDRNVMSAFSERDAKAFAREFRRMKARAAN